LNTSLHPAAEQWVGIWNGELVCHQGFIQFPMRKGWKRGHRLVVLPDFQGIGIGTAFENYTSQHYADKGWKVNVTTTTPALVYSLKSSKKWSLVRFGRVKNTLSKNMKKYYKKIKGVPSEKTSSSNRVTYSFNFVK